jgi:hypothetical protein
MDLPLTPQGLLTENATDFGPATWGMLRERATELAKFAGRAAHEVAKSDWDQARRELLAEPEVDPKEALLEAAPESDRWNPVPGSAGRQAPEFSEAEEDEEGRGESAQLVDEGVIEAERDQAREAGRTDIPS